MEKVGEEVVLVDGSDRQIGIAEKMAAHQRGDLHRAFSVYLFDREGRILLQRRAQSKYHCGGLWSNSCCSHPRPGEEIREAVLRRLREELGIACRVRKLFQFTYRFYFSNGLIEHELDHVFVGEFDGEADANADEVMEIRWQRPEELAAEIELRPESFTPWLRLALPRVIGTC